MIDAATAIAFLLITAAGALCAGRLLRSDTLADRVVALDLFLVIIVMGIAIGAVRTGDGRHLDLLVVTSLLGFVGTTIAARFIEQRGV